MEHQPFETWLLNDDYLDPQQQRELRRHTAACSQCAGLARANLSLRAAPVAQPANGFALRFQRRLAAQRQIQRRRTYIGLSLLTLVSMGLLLWLLTPLLPYLSLSPAQFLMTWVEAVVFISSLLQAFATLSEVFSRIVFGLIPPAAWLVFLMASAGFGALWLVSIRRKPNHEKVYSRARL
ncbi:MAG: hypothetical protein RBS68_07480 [Anaerolineales bacterium]|jgi:hypothetical protein|nr:hypothetical protein [Anaerolineales bacterium]